MGGGGGQRAPLGVNKIPLVTGNLPCTLYQCTYWGRGCSDFSPNSCQSLLFYHVHVHVPCIFNTCNSIFIFFFFLYYFVCAFSHNFANALRGKKQQQPKSSNFLHLEVGRQHLIFISIRSVPCHRMKEPMGFVQIDSVT